MNVSAADICFWNLDSPQTHQAIALFNLLNAVPEHSQLRSRVAEAIEQFPKLRLRRKAKPSSDWEASPHFSLNDHLRFVEVETSAIDEQDAVDKTQLKQEYLKAAETEFSKPLPLDKPLWKIVVFYSNNSAKAALLYVIHHSLADGLSGMALFYSLCDASAKPQTQQQARRVKTVRKSLSWGGKQRFRSVLRLIADGLVRPHRNMLRGTNSAQRRLVTLEIPMKTFGSLRSRYKLNTNQCYLLLLTAGIRNLLLTHRTGELRCAGLIPVNLREMESIQSLGNHLSAVRIPLPVAEDSLATQASVIKSAVERIQTDGSFHAYQFLSRVLVRLPYRLRTRLLNLATNRVDCICTNAPGPRDPRWIGGAEITNTFGIPALMRGQGLGFAAVRYRKSLTITMVYDPQVLSEPVEVLLGMTSILPEATTESLSSSIPSAAAPRAPKNLFATGS